MQTAARKSLQVPVNSTSDTRQESVKRDPQTERTQRSAAELNHTNGERTANGARRIEVAENREQGHEQWTSGATVAGARTTRVFVAAGNRLVREALSRTLRKVDDLEIAGTEVSTPFSPEILLREPADILLLSCQGTLSADLQVIRKVRAVAPDVKILLIGMTGEDMEFLQCVRSGVRGYLLRDASVKEVLGAVRALRAGQVVCPGTLCALLFRYFEREACSVPSASIHQSTGLTRREQQLIPMIAEGRTNKEIANHFCLSEQTVKNHLYRMKHKVGAGDRLGIVQVCRTQGFLV